MLISLLSNFENELFIEEVFDNLINFGINILDGGNNDV